MLGRRVVILVTLAGCGRWNFEEREDGGSGGQDAALRCWSGAVNISQNAGESYAPTIASDGNAIYAVWTDATGYVHDFVNGTENLFFRRIEMDGSLVAPQLEIPRAALGTSRHQFPSMLLHDGQLVLSYSGQAGAIDSGGQPRMIRLALDGTVIGVSSRINDEIVAPNPGTTAWGLAHDLQYVPSLDRFLVSVHGKYPWGGIGAWNRSAYFVDPTTLTRDGGRVCFDNCPPNFTVRSGHVAGGGRFIYRAADDNVTMLMPSNEPYGSATWTIMLRHIDRNDAQIGPTGFQDSTMNVPALDEPYADMVESDQAFIAAWTIWRSGTNHDVVVEGYRYDGGTIGQQVIGTVSGVTIPIRMAKLADGRIAVVVSSDTAQYLAVLDASGAVLSALTKIADAKYVDDALLAVGNQLLIASTVFDNEIYLRCFEP